MNQSERKIEIQNAMRLAREKTLQLMKIVPEEFFKQRVHDFYSPIGWHFGHIGMTEEFWVMRQALGRGCRDERLSFLFANIPDNPKDNRVYLPSQDEIIRYLQDTRIDAVNALEQTDISSADPLLSDGYAWEFALQHECQHQETITEMLQLISSSNPAASCPSIKGVGCQVSGVGHSSQLMARWNMPPALPHTGHATIMGETTDSSDTRHPTPFILLPTPFYLLPHYWGPGGQVSA